MYYNNEYIVPCKVEEKGENTFVTIGVLNFTSDGAIKSVKPFETLSLEEYHQKYRPVGAKVRAKKRTR